ncbi:MAG: hypothetical protein H6815_10690 [Phycisphaeraceae bacterium]|nr:hypothetical protein [Phycisphaerales bacterium]MCB9860904.1 hypothetical protein [Phycisphaeraceae bacterium]
MSVPDPTALVTEIRKSLEEEVQKYREHLANQASSHKDDLNKKYEDHARLIIKSTKSRDSAIKVFVGAGTFVLTTLFSVTQITSCSELNSERNKFRDYMDSTAKHVEKSQEQFYSFTKDLRDDATKVVIETTKSELIAVGVEKSISDFLKTEGNRVIELHLKKSKDKIDVQILDDFIKQNPSYMPVPVGTVIASMLPPDKFASLVGDVEKSINKKQWVLADGQNVAGSTYASIAKELLQGQQIYMEPGKENSVPDLRGVFLRGINAGRDRFEDPDGERAAGSFQRHAFASHQHWMFGGSKGAGANNLGAGNESLPAYARSFHPPGAKSTDPIHGESYEIWSSTQTDDASLRGKTKGTGGVETRPNNVAVYYYIRIN